jgi:hypothetical protein
MPGTLLLSPTGSGKSWACKNIPLFRISAIDGDTLINWKFEWTTADWIAKDREHLDIVLSQMRNSRKCVCWYVGTNAVADALDERRLSHDEIVIVLLPEEEHRNWVNLRSKKGHNWQRALEHRELCERLIRNYQLPQYHSFAGAAEHIKARLESVSPD